MYLVSVILLLLVFPAASVVVELAWSPHGASIMPLIGRWYVFWASGIRLFIAGLRQVLQPRFTAAEIFGVDDRKAFAIVREVGFANLSMGALGICTAHFTTWLVPAAIVGGLYYGLAGLGHIGTKDKNTKEYTAMISDGFAFLVLLAFVIDGFL